MGNAFSEMKRSATKNLVPHLPVLSKAEGMRDLNQNSKLTFPPALHCFIKSLFKINIKLREEKGRLRAGQKKRNKN